MRYPPSTHIPRSDRRNWMKSSGIARNRNVGLIDPHWSSKLAPPQAIPITPYRNSANGMAAAGTATTQRSERRSSVGMRQRHHTPRRMPVTEVDHGSDAATATAIQSAASAKRARSSTRSQSLTVATGCIVMPEIAGLRFWVLRFGVRRFGLPQQLRYLLPHREDDL